MGVATEELRGSAVTLCCYVREKEEVAVLYETALAAGARGIRELHAIFRGGHIGFEPRVARTLRPLWPTRGRIEGVDGAENGILGQKVETS